jgi:type IV pilus assembly protein PilV
MNNPQRLIFNGERAAARGFSLIEVLVALTIIGVGMLGIAKIQALAYASTATASLRSLAAIEAASLAAAMRANHNYWSVAAAGAQQTINVTGNAVTGSTDGALVGSAVNCSQTVCSVNSQLAAYDLDQWAQSLYTLLPSDTAVVVCQPPAAATPNYPVGCSITVSWVERRTGINAQSQGPAAPAMTAPSYTLYVEP